ncbi:hypothetical protein CRUP_010041 [Coryphaenoides rupestris]|nr:hypothetical protein CRUP_010041 [Coryphaenoides rupestris]
MPASVALCLEALSALTGCSVEPTDAESQLSPQDIVNIAVLKQFFKQVGLQELEYPSLGSLSLRGNDEDVEDLYSAPAALQEGPCSPGPCSPEPGARISFKINPKKFFDPKFDYDFTNINRSVVVGEDLVLELYTPQAQRVIFQDRGNPSKRLRESPGGQQVVLSGDEARTFSRGGELYVRPFSPISPAPVPEVVVCAVGGQTVLPCSWAELPATAHVDGADRMWSAAEYRGRVEIPEEQLAAGNCSLVLRDVQNMDAGVYGIRGQGRVASRVFVHSVHLRVLDHKVQRSVVVGEDLVLELYTPQAQRVIFQDRGNPSKRLRESPGGQQVVLSGVSLEDQGFYKVLDHHGLAVSTLRLTVHESTSATSHSEEQISPVQSTAAATCQLLSLCVLASWFFLS